MENKKNCRSLNSCNFVIKSRRAFCLAWFWSVKLLQYLLLDYAIFTSFHSTVKKKNEKTKTYFFPKFLQISNELFPKLNPSKSVDLKIGIYKLMCDLFFLNFERKICQSIEIGLTCKVNHNNSNFIPLIISKFH